MTYETKVAAELALPLLYQEITAAMLADVAAASYGANGGISAAQGAATTDAIEGKASFAATMWQGIYDWVCPSAYAADKGNPPVAHWQFDEGGGPTAYEDLCRKTDFFQGDFMEGILIAAKSLTRIQNLYASKLPFRVIISSNSFSEVFGGNRSLFKSNVEGVDLGVVGDSHISSFSRIIYVNRYYNNFAFFFYEDWPYLLSFIKSIVPGIFERKITTALHSVHLSRFPASCANSFSNFFFSSAAKADLFFSMFTEANRFRNIIHDMNISRVVANVKGDIVSVIARLTQSTEAISDWLCPSAYAASKGADPVAHWRFDEAGGPTAYDETANNNDGTLTPGTLGTNTAAGQMWTRQGKIGAALECDGTDDRVSVADKSDWAFGTNPFTIALWAKWNSIANIESIIGQSTGGGSVAKWALVQNMNTSYAYDSTKLTFMVYNAGESFAVWNWTPAIGTWYHIAITRSGNSFNLYVNGVQTGGTQTTTVTIPDVASDLRIGSDGEAWNFFNGLIDDVKIYNYARAADQILVDYNAGSAVHLGAGTDPNEGNPPVGYWKFDENTGTTAYDRSGNNNNGNISGATWIQGKYGTALSFDGNDAVTVPNTNNAVIPVGNAAFTISLWFNSSELTTSTIKSIMVNEIYQNSGFRYGTDSNRKLVFWASESGGTIGLTSNVALAEGRWHHAVIVYTGSSAKMYLDGVEVASNSSGTVISNTVDIKIAQSIGGKEYFKGLIDEVKIYNYARTQAQIAYDYNKGKPVAHYKFDEGGGPISHNEYSSADTGAAPAGWWRMDNNWNDASGNGNNGIASGTAAFSTTAKIGPYSGTFASGDYVDCGNNAVLRFPSASKFTVEAWFRPTTVDANWRTVVGKGANDGNEEICLLFNSTNIYFDWGSGSGYVQNNGSLISVNNWYHIVAVYDADASYSPNSTKGSVYLNGVLISRDAGGSTSHIEDSSSNLRIGVSRGTSFPFVGQIDDVRIYNYARSAEQIYNDYKTTHGTIVGDTKFVDGKIGKALNFDGSGDYVIVDVDSWIRKCEYITITGWYYHTADTNGAPWGIMTNSAAGAGDGFWWHVKYTGNAFYLRTEDNVNGESDGTGTPFVSAGNWYHIATVIGTNTFKVYKDGALYWSWAPNNNFSWVNVNSDPAYFFIGRSYYDDATGVNGKIDDVRLYNYERTIDQIMQDYNAGVAAHLGAPSAGIADPWGGALPVGHWKMDENTGVLAQDASGNGNNGTLTNGPTWAQGKVGPCLNFDGINDKVVINPFGILNFNNAHTFSCWFKYNGFMTGNNGGKGGLFTIASPTTGGLRIYTADAGDNSLHVQSGATNVSSGTLSDQTWYHYVYTYDGANIVVYIDGKRVTSVAQTISVTGGYLEIGYTQWWHNGFIDDVRIYNYARTQAQIAWDYNQGKPAGHWRFDEGSGTTAYDESDNNNDGTITIGATGTQTTIGAAWTTGATGKFGKCMNFDGTDDYVNCGNGSSLNFAEGNEWTVSSWIKTSASYIGANGGKKPVLKGTGGAIAGYAIAIGQLNSAGYDNKVGFVIDKSPGNNYVVSTNSLPLVNDGNWHHVAIVFDAKNNVKVGGTIYFDGVSYGYVNSVVDRAGWSADASQVLKIGGGAGEYFIGLIDDVRVYNYTRTAEQVQQDYLNGAAARLGD